MKKYTSQRAIDLFRDKFGKHMAVIDVRSGNRFDEPVIAVTVPTATEQSELNNIFPPIWHGCRVHLSCLLGIGALSKGSSLTKQLESLAFKAPYNIYGTPEHAEFEKLCDKVKIMEVELWEGINDDAKSRYIENEIARIRNNTPAHDFGNCWGTV